MRKTAHIVAIVITLMLVFSLPVLAYSYSVDVQVQETNGNSYAPMAITVDIDNQELVDNSFIKDTALDTRIIYAGVDEMAHMVVDDRTNFFAYSIPGNSTNHFDYTWGNSDLTSMAIVPGYGGYITTVAASLDISTNFEIEVDDGYFSFTDIDAKMPDFVYKASDYYILSGDGGFVAIPNPTALTGASAVLANVTDPDAAWANEGNVKDANTATGADLTTAAGADSWSSFLVFDWNPSNTIGIEVYAESDADWILIDVDSSTDGTTWFDIYEGAYTNLGWDEYYPGWKNSSGTVYFRVRFYNDNAAPQTEVQLLREINYLTNNYSVGVAHGTYTAGEYDIKAVGDGVDHEMYVNSVLKDSEAWAGQSVSDNGNTWVLMDSSISYMGYYKHTVNGTLIAWYQPVTMIIGTTLPDRETGASTEDGTFTLGANPAGVDVTWGSAVPGEQVVPMTLADTDPEDIIVEGGTTNPVDYTAPPDGTIAGTAYTMVDTFIDLLNEASPIALPDAMVFINLFAVLVTCGIVAYVAIRVPRHLLMAFAVGLLVFGMFVGLHFLPWWVMAIYAPLGIALLVMERKPVL